MKKRTAREGGVAMMWAAVLACAVVGLSLALWGGRAYCAPTSPEATPGSPFSGQTVSDVEKGEPPAGGTKAPGNTTGLPGFGSVVKMLLWLVVVVACIYAAVYFIRRYVPTARTMFGGGVMKVVGRTYVSSRQSILMVKVGSKFVMVGVTGANLTALSEITDPEEVRKLTDEISAQGGRGIRGSFRKALSREGKKYAGATETGGAKSGGESALDGIRQELDAVRNKVNWWRRGRKE
jgi:flagellar biosynthetic protein FliO